MTEGAFHHRLGGRVAEPLEEIALERARVDPDSYGEPVRLRLLDDFLDLVAAADIARVDPELGDPRSATSTATLWSKWISATIGTLTLGRIFARASTLGRLGTLTRTMSHPASSSRLISSRVFATSVVFVVVIDWTEIGAPPPMGTLPTMTRLVLSRVFIVTFLRVVLRKATAAKIPASR